MWQQRERGRAFKSYGIEGKKGHLCKASSFHRRTSHLWTLSASLNRETHLTLFSLLSHLHCFPLYNCPLKCRHSTFILCLSPWCRIRSDYCYHSNPRPNGFFFWGSQSCRHTHQKRQIWYVYTPVSSSGERKSFECQARVSCNGSFTLGAASVASSSSRSHRERSNFGQQEYQTIQLNLRVSKPVKN